MPSTTRKRQPGQVSRSFNGDYTGKFDGSKDNWMTRGRTSDDGSDYAKTMVPESSKPTEVDPKASGTDILYKPEMAYDHDKYDKSQKYVVSTKPTKIDAGASRKPDSHRKFD